jgi:hypothetical protein
MTIGEYLEEVFKKGNFNPILILYFPEDEELKAV